MTYLARTCLLLAALAVAACNNPDRYRAGGPGADDAFGAITSGSVDDPTSPAYFQARVGDRVFFAVDQSTLSDQARGTLADQARWLNDNPGFAVLIEGHADERGTREYNLALGARRAGSVQEYLMSRGVAPGRIRTVTFGKERPVEICSADPCYDVNRRAVTVLASGATS